MAFVIEDGTGISNANALVSDTEFDDYWTDRGTTFSGGTAPELLALKKVAIINATSYMENRFRTRFKGTREFQDQALSFPRLHLYDEDGRIVLGLPDRLKHACIEYAFRALNNDLAPDPIVDATGLKVIKTKEKVGPIVEEIEYAETSSAAIYNPYPTADALLQEYLMPSGGTVMRA